ncbi:MAG: chitobiase/beta-hexosaminidase C-terminal domain-containing protein [Terracidiphilus sp.]
MRMRERRLPSCSPFVCLVAFAVIVLSAGAQTTAPNEWTWVGGSSSAPCTVISGQTVCGAPVHGTLGTPAAANTPGGRWSAATWTDSSSNFWLFGGYNAILVFSDDLWEFNPSTNEWAWMGGSGGVAGSGFIQPGIYGTLGTPAAGNIPGMRLDAATWTDGSGKLWLFGGAGLDSLGVDGQLNDLWEFNAANTEWTWIGGSSTMSCNSSGDCGQDGVYGTLGTPASGNIPGGTPGASSWTDSRGNLWLFGGSGLVPYSKAGYADSDNVWEFNPSRGEWAWMGGSGIGYPGAVYGTLGTPAAGNTPGGCEFSATWTDGSGHFWLFGCGGNDLWEFDPSTNEWTWMGGGSTTVLPGAGVYGTLGTPAVGNIPGARDKASSWTDSGGNLWLFGGFGDDAKGNAGLLNDLWEFNPSAREWAWMGGSSTVPVNGNYDGGQPGVYGTLDAPAAGNAPGGRYGASSWIDSGGNFWLLGGYGYDGKGNLGLLDDFWEFQPVSAIFPAATPTFGVPAGTYTKAQSVTIRDATEDAIIYYTTDGKTPTTSSKRYTGPIAISENETIKAIAVAKNLADSALAEAVYIIETAPPTISPRGGTFGKSQTVTLKNTMAGATIYYTTNGKTPTTSSKRYTGPITVSENETVKAIAVAKNFASSAVAEAAYAIQTAAPTITPDGGALTKSQTVTLKDATADATIYYTTNDKTPTKNSTKYTKAFTLSAKATVKAIAIAPYYAPSVVVSAPFTIE